MKKLIIYFVFIAICFFQNFAFAVTQNIQFEGRFVDESRGLNCHVDLVIEKMTAVKFKILTFVIQDQSTPANSEVCLEYILSEEKDKVNYLEKSPQASNENIIYYNMGSTTLSIIDNKIHRYESVDKNTQIFIYKSRDTNQYYLSTILKIKNYEFESLLEYSAVIQLQKIGDNKN